MADVVGGGGSSLRKSFQRQLYSLVASRTALAVALVLAVLTLNSAFQLAESVVEWSRAVNANPPGAARADPFRNNVAGASFQERLCSPVPIDIVYTWVNGSDPRLAAALALHKARLDEHAAAANATAHAEGGGHAGNATDGTATTRALLSAAAEKTRSAETNDELDSEIAKQLREFLENGGENSDNEQLQQFIEMLERGDRSIYNRGGRDSRASRVTVPPATAAPTAEPTTTPSPTSAADGTTAAPELSGADSNSTASPSSSSSRSGTGGATGTATTKPESSAPPEEKKPEDHFSPSRFIDNGELRYSLRSIEAFAPWVRNIYIVTNGQVPSWLNIKHPRLFIIKHEDIFDNKTHLPTFSSPAIESHLHKIPGISSKFIYLNDDVMFGDYVWPEDFYTHSNGQKVYLSWPVPNCAEGCPSNWIGDKFCDAACNNTACDFDGGDCLNRTATNSTGSHTSYSGSYQSSYTSRYCSAGCPDTWIGDRYCDRACNVPACGYDATDCGVTDMAANLFHVNLSSWESSQLPIIVPPGQMAFYVDLNNSFALPPGAKFAEGTVLTAKAVRTAGFSEKYRYLTVTLNANTTQHVNFFDLKVVLPDENAPTLVTLPIVTQTLLPPPTPTPGPDEPTPLPGEPASAAPVVVDLTRPGKKDADEMRIKVVSSTAASSSSSSSSSYTAGGAGTGGGAQYAQTAYGSYGNSHAATAAPLLVGFMANNTYRALIGLAPLPPTVVLALAELDREFAVDGELTQKGYDRRAQELLAPYTPTSVPPAHAPTSASASHAFDDEEDTDGDNGNGNGTAAAGVRTLLWVDDEAQPDPEAGVAAAGPRLGVGAFRVGRDMLGGDDFDDDDDASERRRPLVTDVWADYRTDLDKLAGGSVVMDPTWLHSQMRQMMVDRVLGTSRDVTMRRLLDTFGDSLKYVNKLYNKRYGSVARKVPSHMPHMIDVKIMEELQSAFPEQYQATSSHQLRSSSDMQYAFAYMYFMMQEPKPFDLDEFWSILDTNKDGVLSMNEIRTLGARVLPWPMDSHALVNLRSTLVNCSRSEADGSSSGSAVAESVQAAPTDAVEGTPEPVAPVDSLTHFAQLMGEDPTPIRIPKAVFEHCQPVIDLVRAATKQQTKYKFELMTENEVAFKMIRNNITNVRKELDSLRKRRHKFVCLNDNIDHNQGDAEKIKLALHELYEWYFPTRSSFELPPGEENAYLYIDELRESAYEADLWRYGSIALVVLLLMLFSSRCIVRKVAQWMPLSRNRAARTAQTTTTTNRREINTRRFLD